ncbi:MAG: HAMP domain-containing protein [Rhodocyclales bacterium]|nr:HAMP domain-containing protein [Rhodocyclales bacterium]
MSFRLKTILGVACIEAVLLAILIFSSLDYLRRSNTEELSKRAHTTARLFATTTKNAVLASDLAALESAVQEVLTNPGVEYARVLGRREIVLAEGGRPELLRRESRADGEDDGVFDVAEEIEVAGHSYGRVEVGLASGALRQVLDAARRQAALIAAIEMGLVALFSFALGSYLTRGLAHLRRASGYIAAGELGFQVDVRGSDELAQTAQAFNDMSRRLAEAAERRARAETEVANYRDNLEQLVARRTAELTVANDDLRRANRELADAHSQLLESERMAAIGQLAAGVAHEINNPVGFVTANLGSVDGYLRKLLDLAAACEKHGMALPPAERRQMDGLRVAADLEFLKTDAFALVEESKSGLARVKKIVQDLSDFASLGAPEWQMADLRRGLESTLNLVHGRLANIDLVRAYGDLPDVECLPSEINQVFMNLLLNAVEAVGNRGTVAVATGTGGDGVWVEVRDSGCGIPAEHLNRVFDPFFTTKPVGQGTGLGLSLSYGIVQRHHGRIHVASAPGEGTTFRVWLPLRQPRQATTA